MMKSFEDVQAMSKDNVEACIASATAITKGLQTVATEQADFSRKSFEKGTAALEQVMAAKSVDKALEAQQAFAKDAYEAYVGQMTKIGEMYMAAAKEAYKPIEEKVGGAVAKASK